MSKKTQWIVLLVLLAILAVVVLISLYRRPSAPVTSSGTTKYSPLGVENSALHWWRLEQARKTEYTKSERNIFSYYVPPPPPPRPPTPANGSAGPAIPPPPPPLTLPVKYFGYSSVPGTGQRRAFLTNGEEVFIVGEGEVLLGQFRILHIGNTTLDFEEISSKRQGKVALEAEEPAA
jgi:hypothetical protein